MLYKFNFLKTEEYIMDKFVFKLHNKALEIAGRFHKTESELIDVLQKIDDKKVFMSLGFSQKGS